MMNYPDPIKIFKALSDETRLRILCLLENQELSVNDIVEILDSSQSRISRHLTVLKEASFLDCRREGTWAYYRKTENAGTAPEMAQAWELAGKWAKERQEVKQDRKKLQELLQKKRKRSHRFYGKHAGRWDEIRATLCGEPVTYQALEALIPPSLTAADIGTGTGHLLLPLARLVKKVVGVDHSPEMLSVAREKAKAAGLNNIELREGEIDELPLKNEEVDAAFAGLVLHHAPDPAAAIAEMARIVKPGGIVAVIDLQSHNEEWMREELADAWLGFDEPTLERWFKKAGLKPVRWLEGLPPIGEDGKATARARLKSFIYYGRKKEDALE
ncbi:MAG: metalloregulator ArsR/SmtB family transcription factor [Candidatus Omnitrophota bacterium]